MGFAEGAGEVVGIVEAGVKGGFGDVHLAALQEGAGAGEALAKEELVKGLAGLAFEDAVEMIGAGAAAAGGLGERELRGAGGLRADDGEHALGQQAIAPCGVTEVLAETLGALGGPEAEGDEAEEQRLDEGGVADIALLVLPDDLAHAIVEQLVIHGAQLERAGGLDMHEAEEHGDLVANRQPAERDGAGVFDEKIHGEAERRIAGPWPEVMADAGGDEEDGPLPGGMGLAPGLDPAAAALVVEDLVMFVLVGLGGVRDGGVLVELDAKEAQDGAAETVINICPEDVFPS